MSDRPEEVITIGFAGPVPLDAFGAMMEGLSRRYPDAKWVTDHGPAAEATGWPITMSLVLGEPSFSDDDDGYGHAPTSGTSDV